MVLQSDGSPAHVMPHEHLGVFVTAGQLAASAQRLDAAAEALSGLVVSVQRARSSTARARSATSSPVNPKCL